jgi:hypothetical protein
MKKCFNENFANVFFVCVGLNFNPTHTNALKLGSRNPIDLSAKMGSLQGISPLYVGSNPLRR